MANIPILIDLQLFCAVEADTLESSTILIYSELKTGLYTLLVLRGSHLN